MAFRQKKKDVTTEHQWKQFVATHAALFQELGVPSWVSDDHSYWQDVISYGYPEQYQERGAISLPRFDLKNAESSQLACFVKLLTLYFEAGFVYYEPEFLKWQDAKAYKQIVERFAP